MIKGAATSDFYHMNVGLCNAIVLLLIIMSCSGCYMIHEEMFDSDRKKVRELALPKVKQCFGLTPSQDFSDLIDRKNISSQEVKEAYSDSLGKYYHELNEDINLQCISWRECAGPLAFDYCTKELYQCIENLKAWKCPRPWQDNFHKYVEAYKRKKFIIFCHEQVKLQITEFSKKLLTLPKWECRDKNKIEILNGCKVYRNEHNGNNLAKDFLNMTSEVSKNWECGSEWGEFFQKAIKDQTEGYEQILFWPSTPLERYIK